MDRVPTSLELYQVYVTTITATEARRQQANTAYLSFTGVSVAIFSAGHLSTFWFAVLLFLISLIWEATVRYFRRLSQAKFHVIGKLEKEWLLKPFGAEWEHFKTHQSSGTDQIGIGVRYIPLSLTYVELAVPVAMNRLCIAYLLWLLLGFFRLDEMMLTFLNEPFHS